MTSECCKRSGDTGAAERQRVYDNYSSTVKNLHSFRTPDQRPEPKVVGLEEWTAARKSLLQKEKELMRSYDQVVRQRQELPWVRVENDYTFEGENGPIQLSELFGEKDTLVVQHLMGPKEWDNVCPSCCFWADGVNGQLPHLQQKLSFVVVSKYPIGRLKDIKKVKGWQFPVVSSESNSFNTDFGVEPPAEEAANRSFKGYNFGTGSKFFVSQMPGFSVFFKKPGENEIYRTYSTYARGLDFLNGALRILDITPYGREGFQEKLLKHKEMYP